MTALARSEAAELAGVGLQAVCDRARCSRGKPIILLDAINLDRISARAFHLFVVPLGRPWP
jgi:hypothetical protein